MSVVQLLNNNQGVLAVAGIIIATIVTILIYKKQARHKFTDSMSNLQNSQKFVEMGEGASLNNSHFANNLMLQIANRHTPNKKPSKSLTPAKRKGLANQGSALAKELFQFASNRRAEEPQFVFSKAGLTEELKSNAWENENKKREKHMRDTQSLYEIKFVGRIAEFLDEVQEAGFEVEESFLHLYSHLAGASPIQSTAQQISIIAGRIKRSEDLS